MNKFNQYKVYQGLKPIKSLLPKEVRKLVSSHQNSFGDLKSKWDVIVGKEIAQLCQPEKFKQSSIDNEKTLFLSVPKEYIIETDYSRDYIIEKTNSYFGYSFVNKIVINCFKVSKLKNHTINKVPVLNKGISEKIKLIKNEKLQNAFKEFFKNDENK